MGNGTYDESGIPKNVQSLMGHMLNRVREKNKYENEHEYDNESDSDEQENLRCCEEDHCLCCPPGKWEVRYDNQNYIQSMVNEDKGLHRITEYPKQKWEISYDDRSRVKNLEPYPVRVSIDQGGEEMALWDVPYDNKNYVLSMLAGSGISKTWEEGLIDVERIRERHGHLHNPYDYSSPQDEVIYSSYMERRPRRESYRFDRAERNIHDYESESVPKDEITQPHIREQRRRSTNIYRYGDVERNVHDVADQHGYSRSPPRHRAQQERSSGHESYRFDRAERNIHDYGSESVPEDEIIQPHIREQRRRSTNIYRYGDVERNVHDIADQHRYPTSPPRHTAQKGTKTCYDAINKWKSAMQSSDRERQQNLYNEDLERHYNQHGVEACAHDYDEVRAIQTIEARKHIVPMSFLNVKKSRTEKSGHLKHVAERVRNQLQDKIPLHRESYERVAEDYDQIPAPGSLYGHVIEEHEDHPCDYGTTQEDSYEEYKEDDDGSQTWLSSSEKYAEIHHRSQ